MDLQDGDIGWETAGGASIILRQGGTLEFVPPVGGAGGIAFGISNVGTDLPIEVTAGNVQLLLTGGDLDVEDVNGDSSLFVPGDPAGEIALQPHDAAGKVTIYDAASGEVVQTTGAGELGFFGQTPDVQQHVPLVAPTVQDVIDALVALGLVEQS